MKVFSALLGQVEGVFGKDYLLSGLLPAVVLVFVGNWYLSGDTASDLIAQLEKVASDEESELGTIAAGALLSLALGVVFFAARGWLLDVLQTFPGRRLRWLNRLLVRRQLRIATHARRDAAWQNHYLTVVRWTSEDEFNEPAYRPSFVPVPTLADLQDASQRARKLFSKLRDKPDRLPRSSACRRVLNAWSALHAYAKDHYATEKCQEEITQWRLELSKPGARNVAKVVSDHAYRTWVDSTHVREIFPAEDKWIGPTQLGSRAAALDDYAQQRYGMDSSLMLSRLSGVLDEADRKGLSDARLSVETLVNLSLAAALIAIMVLATTCSPVWSAVCSGADCADSVEWRRAAAFFGATLLASIVLYRGALYAFGGLAERTMRVIDLNRLALLEKMGFVIPADMSAERELWTQLAQFLSPGNPKPPNPDPPLKKPN